MISWLLPLLALVLGLGIAYLGLRLVGQLQWFAGWLRGTAAFTALGSALALGFFSYDLLAYKQAGYDQLIANISFEQMGSRSFEALLVDSEGNESRYPLSGDQWQLDVRMIKWADGVPAKPLYRMDRLGGRYLSLEEQQSAPQSLYSLATGPGIIDAWESVGRFRLLFPFIEALRTSASYLPMVDGAIYSISLGQHGLIARPLNEAATVALGR